MKKQSDAHIKKLIKTERAHKAAVDKLALKLSNANVAIEDADRKHKSLKKLAAKEKKGLKS